MIAAPRVLRSTHGAAIAIVVGMSVFSLQDPIIKALSGTYPVTEATAFRGAFALPLFTWIVWQAGGLRLLWTVRPFALVGRGVLQMLTRPQLSRQSRKSPLYPGVSVRWDYVVAPLPEAAC